MKGQCVKVFETLAGAGGRAGGKFFFFLFSVCILRVVIGYNGGGGGEMETHLEGESPSPPHIYYGVSQSGHQQPLQ